MGFCKWGFPGLGVPFKGVYRLYRDIGFGGFPKLGVPFKGLHNRDFNIYGSILEYPYFGKLPNGEPAGTREPLGP